MEQKILFGLTLPISQKIRGIVEKEILRIVPEMQSVCRYRKEGVFQYAKQQQDSMLIVLEENLQGGSPYMQEEILQLTDLQNVRVIFLLDRIHEGDEYSHFLYCCGIYDALYMDDVTAENIMKLAKSGRGCKEARDYYGIRALRDAERERNIVNEELLNTYLEYVEAGNDSKDVNDRYRFAATRLGKGENQALAGSITAPVARQLTGNEIYQFYKDKDKAKRRWFLKGKVSKTGQEIMADRTQQLKDIEDGKYMQGTTKPEVEGLIKRNPPGCDSGEEDMFATMERYRKASSSSATESVEDGKPAADLLVQMGIFLQTIDT